MSTSFRPLDIRKRLGKEVWGIPKEFGDDGWSFNHLTEHGMMDASLLYESPFTDLTPHGPDGLFTSTQVDELMAVLARVKSAALAA